MKAIGRFSVSTVLPARLAPLEALANNLRWAWHGPTRDLFESLDPEIFARVKGQPRALLARLGPARLEILAQDRELVARIEAAAADLEAYLSGPGWYGTDYAGEHKPQSIAYFSAEFGLTGAMPQYSGGLGILAGDHLKAASDLGVPIIGVGLLYQSGYFIQSLSLDGWQRETYPVLDPDDMPLAALRDGEGNPVLVDVPMPGGRTLYARVWVVRVGRVNLLLLDSNVPNNDDEMRLVTDRLYGGSSEHRLRQELLLGRGGVRALRVWSKLTGAPKPGVFHCNEGHAGFLALERMAELTATRGLDWATALETVRSGTVFTTHTPVPAGIDRFDRQLVANYLGDPGAQLQEMNLESMLSLGSENYEGGDPGVFNMAVFGLRVARRANGVSKLHGEVSRGMFANLWPGFDTAEVPITHITNGVHAATWTDPEFYAVATSRLGDSTGQAWKDRSLISDGELWKARNRMRARLVDAARDRVYSSWLERGASPAELGWVDGVLDPHALTIGFARRVPTYKRLTLMLNDPVRLRALLTDPERPVQIVVAGKSHPADTAGVSLIRELVAFADEVGVRHRIVFLPNYDMDLARQLVPGCDVWLNNPLRPLEASGTSGMKCALNGALNLSILDGWWNEMYDGVNGWAIPTADGVTDPVRRDEIEAAALYDLLESRVVPAFYERDDDGVPARWLEMVRHTLAVTGPRVLASRMVQDYVRELYGPVSGARTQMRAEGFEGAAQVAAWKARLHANWGAVRVDHVEALGVSDTVKVGDTVQVRAYAALGEHIAPGDVTVQLVYGTVDESDRIGQFRTLELEMEKDFDGARYSFSAAITLDISGPFGYTVRIVPRHELIDNPAELALVANAR